MKTRLVFINIIVYLALYSCSNYDIESKPLEIDFSAARIFASQISSKFTDYADTSGYNQFRDSVNIALRNTRGPKGEPVIFLRGNPSQEEIVIYTFDRKDSCIIFSGYLLDENYILYVNTLPIPTGTYLIKVYNSINSFNRE
jgi:hypothetical protein